MRGRLWIALVGFTLAFSAWAGSPNVLLVSLDTYRADRLAAWGGSKDLTPNLNGLAAKGAVFTRCWTPAPVTLPAHATLLTGCFPARTKLHDNGVGTLASGVPTLAQAFSSTGYRTSAVVASLILASRYGLSRGFGRYDDSVGPTRVLTATQVTDRALAQVRSKDPRPFFLWVHYYDTHEPYYAPESFRHKWSGSSYDSAAAYVDAEVGRLLAALPQDTIVAVVSDHGEALGDHGEPTHGVLLFQPTIRVVLILSGTGIKGGQVLDPACSLADVAPTLLAASSGSTGAPPFTCDGANLLTAAVGKSARLIPLETWLPFNQFRWCPLFGVTDGRFKWTRGRRDTLCDLSEDPGETRDLAGNPPQASLAMRDSLPALPEESPSSGEVDPAIRGLGYAPVPGGSLKGKSLPDPRDQTAILQLMGQARLARVSGDLERAANEYGSASERDPANPAALFEYGETLRRLGRLDQASVALDKAVAAGPSMSEAWIAKGHVLVAQSKPDEAAKCYQKALDLAPDAVGALNPLAAYQLDKNKPENAIPLLERAQAEGIADSETFLMLGRVHLIQNKLQDAERDFATSLQLSEDPRRTLKAQADIYVIRSMFDQGMRLYEEGIKLYPDYAPNYLTLATLDLQAEKPDRALALFKKALTLNLDQETRKNVLGIVSELEKGPQQ